MTQYCTLLFLRKGDQILLAMKKRGFGMGKWHGMGGKIELGETIQQAAIRECQEEIGVTPLKLIPAAEHDFAMEDPQTGPWHIYMYVYVCEEWEGEPAETDEMAPKWFNEEDIPYDLMWQDNPFWLPQVLEGAKVHGTYRFDIYNDMLEHTVTTVATLPSEGDMLR
ncbi:MAG TPA: 8-oxo-dGTP diphosphatase [Candidatus Saccharimonadales bacterium]